MKNIFASILLLIPVITFAQDDLRTKDSLALFGPTDVGKPDGEKVNMDIGTAGGHLISSDGKVELIVPAGALTTTMTISIQPVTNCSRTKIGKSYRLEPSGNLFQQPVQLVFYYLDKELDVTPPQLMGIAFQDEKGSWLRLRKIALDTVAKTITGYTKHFTVLTMLPILLFWADKERVKVNKEVQLHVDIPPSEESGPGAIDGDIDLTLATLSQYPEFLFVNNIQNGDAINGKIIKNFDLRYRYDAPANVPDKNPVLVTIKIVQKDYTYEEGLKIWVYDDQYEVKMTASNHNGLIGNGSLNADLDDTGSFIVSMEGKRSRVVDIKNNLYKFTNKSGLKIEYLDSATCTGPINIAGVQELRVSWADPPKQPYAIVEILFMPAKMSLPHFKVKGRDATIPTALGDWLSMMPAWPRFIRFVAKEGEQTIFENHDSGTTIFFTVKRLEE